MAFTAGQVLTAAQLNDLDIDSLVVDTNVLVVDKTNNRVGIGTTSPGEPLHIVTASGDAFLKQENGTATTFSGPDSSNTGLYGTSSNHDTRFITNNTERVRITSSGAVGIGTSSPAGNFQVESQGRAFTIIDSGVSNHAEAAFTTLGGDSPAFSIISAYDMDFQTGTSRGGLTSRMTIGSSGTITTNTDVVPGTDGTIELGTSTYRWQAVHSDRYYLADSDSYIQWDADSGSGIDGPGFRFVINGSEMFKFLRENDTSAHSMITFGENNDGILYEKDAEKFNFYRNGTQVFEIEDSIYTKVSNATLLAANPPTGTGNDAEWAAPLGIYILRRNSSLAAEKENISADLGEHLTADMIDQVVPKMWNRINAPGYPEIGPIAEDMDAISPFLAARGTTAENVPFLTGINKTAYLSLLVLAVKDLRARVAALEA